MSERNMPRRLGESNAVTALRAYRPRKATPQTESRFERTKHYLRRKFTAVALGTAFLLAPNYLNAGAAAELRQAPIVSHDNIQISENIGTVDTPVIEVIMSSATPSQAEQQQNSNVRAIYKLINGYTNASTSELHQFGVALYNDKGHEKQPIRIFSEGWVGGIDGGRSEIQIVNPQIKNHDRRKDDIDVRLEIKDGFVYCSATDLYTKEHAETKVKTNGNKFKAQISSIATEYSVFDADSQMLKDFNIDEYRFVSPSMVNRTSVSFRVANGYDDPNPQRNELPIVYSFQTLVTHQKQ